VKRGLGATLLLLLAGLFAGLFAGHARADVEAGWQAYLRGDFETALGEIRPAAKAGDAQAQFYMGTLHDAGAGVPRDQAAAAAWYERAAEQGHAGAQFALGLLYHDGAADGSVPRDDEKAARWLMAAAEQDNALAQHLVGRMYRLGRGVPMDKERALDWSLKAARRGIAGGQYEVGVLLADNPTTREHLIYAYAWFLLAARQAHPGAAENLQELAKVMSEADIARARASADKFQPRAAGAASADRRPEASN
jgi:TPR repeat protein